MIPGRALHRVAAALCSAKTLERAVEPAIADLQREYGIVAGNTVSRLWVLITGYGAILKVIVICALSVSIETDDERRALVRTLAWCGAMVTVMVVLLMLPPWFDHPRMGWRIAMTLIPQALPLAIPIGIAFGIAFAHSGRPTMNIAKTTLIGAAAASALSFGTLAWAVPAANDAFRRITFREIKAQGYDGPITGLRKGYSEMTLPELRRQIAHFAADGQPRIVRQATFRFHLRFALAAATFALASLLLAVPVSVRSSRLMIVCTGCFCYWALIFSGERGSVHGYLTPTLGAWLPNIALMTFAMVVASWRSFFGLRFS